MCATDSGIFSKQKCAFLKGNIKRPPVAAAYVAYSLV
jgi:hypothetical protein